MSEINKIRIDQLPNGTIELSSPIMFGNGEFIEKTALSNALALITPNATRVKARRVNLDITVTDANLFTFLGGVDLTIESGEVVFLVFQRIKSNGLIYTATYAVPLIDGVYEPLGTFIEFTDLILINESAIPFSPSANTVTYNINTLADINTSETPFDFTDEDAEYLVILGGIPYLFIGTLGFYGAEDLTIEMSDLQLLSFVGGVQSVTGPAVDNTDPNNPVINLIQNNFVRNLTINESDLSGTGTLEEQICEYILALPIEERTIAETDSKWNIILISEDGIHTNVFNEVFN